MTMNKLIELRETLRRYKDNLYGKTISEAHTEMQIIIWNIDQYIDRKIDEYNDILGVMDRETK